MPQQSFYYSLDGRDLRCSLDYEEAERETRYEPGIEANAELCTALEDGVDIYDSLTESEFLEIEVAFLEQEYEY